MIINRVIFLIAFLISASLFQEVCGQINIQEESKVSRLMNMYETLGNEEDYISGWRIKLISTTNRRELESTRYLFRREYPEMEYSQSHENPYYSLKVGAYETRVDLEPMLVRFKVDFPQAIPFRDRILKSELFSSK